MDKPTRILLLCLLVGILNSLTSSAQDRHRLDSLLVQLESESNPDVRTQLLYQVATEYFYMDRDSYLIYLKKYQEAAESAGDTRSIADALYWIAEFFFYSDLDSALYYCEKYHDASINMQDTAWIGYAYESFGFIHMELGEMQLAVENFRSALQCFRQVDDAYQIGACYNNLGYTSTYGSDQSTGLGYFIEALQIAETIQDTSLIADVSTNIAYYYDQLNDNSAAHIYYQRALDLNIALGDSMALANSYAGMAYINVKMGNYEQARHQLSLAVQCVPRLKYPFELADLYLLIADCYILWEDADAALQFINDAGDILSLNTFPVLEANLNRSLGMVYFLQKDYAQSVSYFDRSIELFSRINSFESFAKTYEKKAEALFKLGLYEQAYKNQMLANSAGDSLKYGKVAVLLGQMEQEYEQQQELDQERLEMELAAQRMENKNLQMRSNLKTALFIISLLLLLAGIVIYILFTLRKKNAILHANNTLIGDQKALLEEQVEKLEQHEKELNEVIATKDKLFSIIAHDLKNPFNSMVGFSGLYLKDKTRFNPEDISTIMESLNKSATYGYTLLDNLLEWSLSQTGTLKPDPVKISVEEPLNHQVAYFSDLVREKNIRIEVLTESFPPVFADRNMVHTILRNLIHNAVKFSHNDSTVKIHLKENEDYLQISVEDQGLGMDEADQVSLFTIESKTKKLGTRGEYPRYPSGVAESSALH